MSNNVKREIRKKMLLIRGTRLMSLLAPKFVFVKTDYKNEHFSLTSNLIFDKTCEVSLDTFLFFEKIEEKMSSNLYLSLIHI